MAGYRRPGLRKLFGKVILLLKEVDTLDRLGRPTQNMLAFAEALRGRGAGLRVLNLGGGDVDTASPMGLMVFTVMAALGHRVGDPLPFDVQLQLSILIGTSQLRGAGEPGLDDDSATATTG